MVWHQAKGAFPTKDNQTRTQHLLACLVSQAVPTEIYALTEVMAHAGDW